MEVKYVTFAPVCASVTYAFLIPNFLGSVVFNNEKNRNKKIPKIWSAQQGCAGQSLKSAGRGRLGWGKGENPRGTAGRGKKARA